MSSLEFLKEKLIYIISSFLSIVLTMLIIWALNPVRGIALSIFIGAMLIIGAIIPLISEYINKRNFYNNLINIFDSLDKKNLIADIISPPSFKEGIILYDILKGSNKAMLEEINKYKYLQEEYREYIELWVHEIKTPISSSKLIAQNNKNEVLDSISEELDKIEALVEQVLFYSRSNAVEKDYIIKKVNLKKLCFDVIKSNSRLFIQHNIRVETKGLDLDVFTDHKWMQFILAQILTNSVKYSNKPDAFIKIIGQKNENNIILIIEDNGIGIQESELPRIFDKGFTGTNGRKNERSTGMGLYLCKKLCNKLGHAIYASSKYGEGMKISIAFPKNSMVDIC